MIQKPSESSDKKPDRPADRPLECFECKKPIAILYSEAVGDTIINTSHCIDCPVLLRKLHGIHTSAYEVSEVEGNTTGLCCGTCGTTLEAVQKGNSLGCTECYEVFADVLVNEMLVANKISQRTSPTKSSIPLHIGRAPGENAEITPSLRLLALNEALNETLSREDYEQAAWLRDQIQALTEKEKEEKDGE